MIRPHGIDISHWQGYFKFPANPPRPVDFVIQKLTEGIFRDPSYTTIKAQIQTVPIRGGYHYFRGIWSWKDQMDTFLSQLDGYDFWALDVEKQNNYKGVPLFNKPAAGYVDSLPLALEYLAKYKPGPGLIYTGPSVWCDWLKPIWAELLRYDLWVAHYWYKPNPDSLPNYFTVKGAETMRKDWRFWQYAAKGGRGKEYGVGSLDLDLDVFNGTLAALYAWAKRGTAPPAPVPVPEIGAPVDSAGLGAYKVTAARLNVFMGPGSIYKQSSVSPLRKDAVVNVLDIVTARGEKWAKLESPSECYVRAVWLKKI